MSLTSPITRLRRKGSAKEGVHHWITLRFSAIALIPLTLWFLASLIHHFGAGVSHAEFILWLKKPYNTLLTLLLVVTSYYHGFLGSREIVEDYVHKKGVKYTLLIVKQLAAIFLASATVFAVLSIYFKG